MAHRHMFNPPEMFEMANDQNPNLNLNQNPVHVQQPFAPFGRGGGAWESSSVVSPVPIMSGEAVNSVPHWTAAPRSNEYSASSTSMDVPRYEAVTSGPFYDPYPRPSAATNFHPVPQYYAGQPSSSNSQGHSINGLANGIVDPVMGSGRGPFKRKIPVIPDVSERGDTSRYYNPGAGCYSDYPINSTIQPEKPIVHPQHRPWDTTGTYPTYSGCSLSIAEGSDRNVRSRPSGNIEPNIVPAVSSSNSSLHVPSAGSLVDHSVRVDIPNLNVIPAHSEWNHVHTPFAAHGRVSSSGTNSLNQGPNQFLVGGSDYNPVGFDRYHHNTSVRYPVFPPHNIQGATQAVRGGGYGSFPQRAVPPNGIMPSQPNLGYWPASSVEGLNPVQESHSSRYSRTSSAMGYHNGDRSARSRLSYDRLRSLPHDAYSHDRRVAEGYSAVDRVTTYGSRNLFDQHGDMRLDVDSMSYEELLALGERIGNVSTGLSEDLILKCLTMTVISNTEIIPEEHRCVICLDEYRKEEQIGRLRNCGHDYHVGCIKRWLSMKNACPICKAPVLADN
ncbi:hypothetical protein MKW98_026772 [Papaver atlanticum]|uniref:RING-type E3 ubiquitin transferase n=1 Tax=Papaver atlanticum TaxID=357466 RepID=A0AAD4X5G3_9MAGN|nr:hypothetical protein MKW98_026772 [Papaver atlanticum]